MRWAHVNAFASQAFTGNPAAVCLFPPPEDERWMHALASELRQPMTSFVFRDGEGSGFRLRWFNASGEAKLCGHGTLAAAHVLWQSGDAQPGEPIRFHTLGGELLARQLADGWIEIDFPAEPAQPEALEDWQPLASALGVKPLWIGRNRLYLLVEVEDEKAVRALRPETGSLAGLLAPAVGAVVTARAESGAYDFVSRCFVPGLGIEEDFATGSSHCALAPFWAPRLGKQEMLAFQASSRGGVLRVRLPSSGGEPAAPPRVCLAGQAVTLITGELTRQGLPLPRTRTEAR